MRRLTDGALAVALVVVAAGVWPACGDDSTPAADAARTIDAPRAADAPALGDAGDLCAEFRAEANQTAGSARGLLAAFGLGPAGTACDPVAQTGCRAGEKCAFVLDSTDPPIGHVGCVADGFHPLGEACLSPDAAGAADDCAAGGHCYNGTCRQICTPADDHCLDAVCTEFVDGQGSPFPFSWCLYSCQPLLQNCAIENEACYVLSGQSVCAPHLDAPLGQPCVYPNECAPGLHCAGPQGGTTCHQFCGSIGDTWSRDGGGNLGWPSCCGAGCRTACQACPGLRDVCWPIDDDAGGLLDIGFCQTDGDASDTDGVPPDHVCDCSAPQPNGDVCVEL